MKGVLIVAITNDLKMVTTYAGGDTRTITVPNPKSNLTQESFAAFTAAAAGVLISDDKNNRPFTGIRTAYYSRTETTDIEVNA